MRALKFRVWSKNLGKYIGGMLLDQAGNLYSMQLGFELSEEDSDNYIIELDTGIKDKNGKEIYEGDIGKCYSTADEPCLAVVKYGRMPDICGHEYCPCKVGFYLDDKVYFDEDFGEDDDHGEIEVIGNINENKELLKGE